MPLDFPASPVNGQRYGNYYFDSSVGTGGAWRAEPIPVGGLPAGSIIQWSTNTPPANWLICDGSAVSRSLYPSLFAAVGTTYGAGDGSTTFNLPDLRGRVAVGRDGSQSEFDLLGETGGAKTHTLSVNEMPGHSHNIRSDNGIGGNGLAAVAGSGTDDSNYAFQDVGRASLTQFGTASVGGGQPHNNLQPYLVTNYIIKATAGWTAGDSELATRVGALEAAPTGLVRLTPLSVSVASGSASSTATGLVTFSNVSSVSLNGVLNSAYTDFVIVLSSTNSTGQIDNWVRFRNGTSDVTSTYYGASTSVSYNVATGTYGQINNGSAAPIGNMGTLQSGSEITMSPRAGYSFFKYATHSPASAQNVRGSYNASTATRPDGFTLYPNSSTISGTIQVYGYRN